MSIRKISDLSPHAGDLSDNDQFVIVDVSSTSGPDAGDSGQTRRISASKVKEKMEGEKGESGTKGDTGTSPTFTYNESTGVLTITTQ